MSVTQDQFRTALLDPAAAIPDGLTDGAGRPAGRRFDVHRNNVAVSLTEAMRTAFPVITKLLGQANMDGLSGLFLRRHPPGTPLMMHYGDRFPGFLADMPALAHLGYLGDVARLELALRRSYHAADADPIDPQDLGRIPPEALGAVALGLAPSVELVRSAWPIVSIWRFNTEPGAPRPPAVAEDALITRPDFDPRPEVLPPGGADWIVAIRDGATIGAAFDAATATQPDFDLGATLALLLQGGAITSLSLKETDPCAS